MSFVVKSLTAGAVLFAAGAKYLELKTPHIPTTLPMYHGSTSDRLPDRVGEFVVKNHLFFTHDCDYAKSYAVGEGASAFRLTPDDANGIPFVARISVDPGTHALRGVFGGHSYFPEGTKVKVDEIIYTAHD